MVAVALRLGAKISPFPGFQASAIADRRAACPRGLGLGEQSGGRAGRTSWVRALGRQTGGHLQAPLVALGAGVAVEGCGFRLGRRGLRWRCLKGDTDLTETPGATAVGQETEMAHAHQAFYALQRIKGFMQSPWLCAVAESGAGPGSQSRRR